MRRRPPLARNSSDRRRRRSRASAPKREPSFDKRRSRLPQRTTAALAVMQMGISDFDVIAKAVGLTVDEVKKIDSADDARVREFASQGFPSGEYFTLRRKVRCPRCYAQVTIAPCVACSAARG